MTEQQPSSGSTHATATPRPASRPVQTEANRRAQVMWGGLLAGVGLSITAAFVMHVVQEAAAIGSSISIQGSVLAVLLIAGPIFGLGVGTALLALIPQESTDAPAAPSLAPPADLSASQAPGPDATE